MSLRALVQEFDGKEIGEDKQCNPIFGRLLPPLSQAEFSQLEAAIPCKVPREIQEVLGITRGLVPSLHLVDFSGLSLIEEVEVSDMCPYGLPIAGDVYGNFWVVDLLPFSKDWAPVYYVCHDPPVLVLQANSFEEFVAQLMDHSMKEPGGFIEQVHENLAHKIYSENPNVVSFENAIQLSGADSSLSEFAESLGKDFQFIDLRRARIGDGFNWGRYGADTIVKRFGEERIFAYKKKPSGWLGKLFGK